MLLAAQAGKNSITDNLPPPHTHTSINCRYLQQPGWRLQCHNSDQTTHRGPVHTVLTAADSCQPFRHGLLPTRPSRKNLVICVSQQPAVVCPYIQQKMISRYSGHWAHRLGPLSWLTTLVACSGTLVTTTDTSQHSTYPNTSLPNCALQINASSSAPPTDHPVSLQPHHISAFDCHTPHTLKYTQVNTHTEFNWVHRAFLQKGTQDCNPITRRNLTSKL